MIFQGHARPSIPEAMAYVLGPGRDNVPDRATLLGGQGFEFEIKTDDDVELATDLMEHNAAPHMQASRTKKCALDALHASAAWDPNHRAAQDEMLEAGRYFLKSIGMEKSMAVFHRHSDKKHPHMHMVASLIHPKTGLTFDRFQFRYKALHAGLEWERIHNQITPARQPQHDQASAARDLDWDRLQALLRNKEGRIAYGKVDQALALGGHFGPHMVAHRVAFQKHLGIEPGRTKQREAAVEPEQTAPDYLDHGGCLPPPKRDRVRNLEVNGNFIDRTDATTPGLLPPKRDKGRGLER